MDGEDKAYENTVSRDNRNTESIRLEKTLKIIVSNHKPRTAKTSTKTMPHLHVF